jgi:hypothetical protein
VLAFVGRLVAQGKIEIGPSLAEISSALSCLGASRTPAATAHGSMVMPASKKPAQNPTHALQQTTVPEGCDDLFDHLVGKREPN